MAQMNFWMFRIISVFLLWVATFTPSEKVALASAFLVLIGVIGEYVVEVKAVEDRKLLAKKIKRLSMGLLVLGLSGDVLGIVMSQSEMAVLTRQSSDAATSAKTAHDEASAAKDIADAAKQTAGEALHSLTRAESDAAKAQAVSSNALALARDARQQSADALTNLTAAKQLAEEAQKGTEQLRLAAKARRLSEAQKVELVRLFSSLPPFTVVFDATRSGSDEVLDFTDDFIDVFIRLKLMPVGSSSRKLNRAIGAEEGHGVIVGVMGQTEHPAAAEVLIKTLRSWGFEVSGGTAPTIIKSATEMHILIGAKQ
jgi:hypothetical protein